MRTRWTNTTAVNCGLAMHSAYEHFREAKEPMRGELIRAINGFSPNPRYEDVYWGALWAFGECKKRMRAETCIKTLTKYTWEDEAKAEVQP